MNSKRRPRSVSAARRRVAIPPELDWWRAIPGGSRWLDSLPDIVAACSERWRIRTGKPYQPASISLVLPAKREDGSPAVLKINFPDRESEQEAAALAHWEGRGAVRLLAHDPERWALLIERCTPGGQPWTLEDDDEATLLAAGVMDRLWRPALTDHPFTLLADQAAR